jgi:hypothetical protein
MVLGFNNEVFRAAGNMRCDLEKDVRLTRHASLWLIRLSGKLPVEQVFSCDEEVEGEISVHRPRFKLRKIVTELVA